MIIAYSSSLIEICVFYKVDVACAFIAVASSPV